MGKLYYIYKHTFPNNKVYIGKTCCNPKYRWGKDGNRYWHNKEMYEDIQKFGWDNIKHEILYDGLTREEASQLEFDLVEQNKDNCYNKVLGGDGYFIFINGEKKYLNDIANDKKLNPNNLSKNEIRNRLFHHKFDIERALGQPKGKKNQPYTKLYEYNGKMYTTKELADMSPWNLYPSQIRDRIDNKHFTVERAVMQKPRKSRTK
jgi:hypothetical protein